jgi:hypothetical protein
MNLSKATRKRAKMRLSIQGPSGSGKTYGALLVAFGLCSDWSKIAVIDTENSSAELYAHLGDYNTLQLSPPFNPEKFIEAIRVCENEKMEVIIIDSSSHEWDGIGGIIDIHSKIPGNSFTAWSKVTPRHNAFVQAILNAGCHVISTVRSKQDYVLTDRNGKQVPEKIGLKGIQKDGYDYESTIAFEVNLHHRANVSKDRTELFTGQQDFVLNVEVGSRLRQWCEQGEPISIKDLTERINKCVSIKELLDLYQVFPQYKESLKPEFENRKRQILINQNVQPVIIDPVNITTNGLH